MDAFKNCNAMKKLFASILLPALAFCLASCEEVDIPVYKVEDSAVFFATRAVSYSLKGFTGAEKELEIPVSLIGPVCDYDREIKVAVVDTSFNTAAEGRDFTVVSAGVPAGALSGKVVLNVKNLAEDVDKLAVLLEIQPNDNFARKVSKSMTTQVVWSKEYVRPSDPLVWDSWFLFFSKSYSRNLHEIIVSLFGEEVEISSQKTGARKREDLIYRQPSWWYAASRELFEYVRDYDKAHPDAPLMHSSDYELYQNSSVPVGEGYTPDRIPTILETLLII